MNTSTMPVLPSTPIIKLTGPNGGGAGYQVGNFLILSGYGYKLLSGDGPGGFSADLGLVDLRTLPAIQESRQPKTEEKPMICYWDLPRWTWDGCSVCSSIWHTEQPEVTDVGVRFILKCNECNTLHRKRYGS